MDPAKEKDLIEEQIEAEAQGRRKKTVVLTSISTQPATPSLLREHEAHLEKMKRDGYTLLSLQIVAAPGPARAEEYEYLWALPAEKILDAALVHLDEWQKAGQFNYLEINRCVWILCTLRDLCRVVDRSSTFWGPQGPLPTTESMA